MNRGKILAAGALAALMMAGCGQESDDSESMPPPPDSLWDARLEGCAFCHSPGSSVNEGPDMSTQESFLTGMKNKTANEDYPRWADIKAGDCNDVPLIDPVNPEGYLIVASLVQDYSDNLSAAENCVTAYNIHNTKNESWDGETELINELTSWIEQGG